MFRRGKYVGGKKVGKGNVANVGDQVSVCWRCGCWLAGSHPSPILCHTNQHWSAPLVAPALHAAALTDPCPRGSHVANLSANLLFNAPSYQVKKGQTLGYIEQLGTFVEVKVCVYMCVCIHVCV